MLLCFQVGGFVNHHRDLDIATSEMLGELTQLDMGGWADEKLTSLLPR